MPHPLQLFYGYFTQLGKTGESRSQCGDWLFFSFSSKMCNNMSKAKTEVPRDVRYSKVQKQDKFRRYWSLDHTLNFCRNLVIFRSKNICQKESLNGLLRWSSIQTKEDQRHTEFHLVGFENSQTPSTTTVWPSDHRGDYRSCAWPFYSLVRTFPKALHSD